MEKVMVGIAEGKIVRGTQILASYALGSCVGVCLYDPGKKIAGMAHVVLPGKEAASDRGNPYKFAREGTIMLLQEMISNGADKKKITAKIVGGAKMFETQGKEWEIGKQNVKAVKETLLGEGVKVLAEETGKNYGRTVFFYAETGKVQVNTVKRQTIVI